MAAASTAPPRQRAAKGRWSQDREEGQGKTATTSAKKGKTAKAAMGAAPTPDATTPPSKATGTDPGKAGRHHRQARVVH
jgi:hypothetical protein